RDAALRRQCDRDPVREPGAAVARRGATAQSGRLRPAAAEGADDMPAQLTDLKVRDVTVRLYRAGSGPTVLFLHGAGGVPQWLPFFDALAERYEVLVPEHPGFGGSDDPPWIRSMPDLALFYLDLIEAARLDPIHLIGNSLGGWLAAEILIRDRSRFKSLVPLAPAGIRKKGVPCGDNFIWGP